ncbi:hypothetical protein GUJ93_ZPchr0001g29740 [Zizania palustris]|uniref:Zinc finger LSD1-type domain-containing protein n=1 Tax=Zizania palustris TaxID=103762 RepID=A0A8J5RSF1_ZIZPA|nr:hypothetical protein GUJ93_ZPchr0001g29740 [Zizania palustris]
MATDSSRHQWPPLRPDYRCLRPPLRLRGQSQLVCSGCRNLLMYPAGATSVCCAVCSTMTVVPAPGISQGFSKQYAI